MREQERDGTQGREMARLGVCRTCVRDAVTTTQSAQATRVRASDEMQDVCARRGHNDEVRVTDESTRDR